MVADLVINKPLGLSPRLIEFKRAHLHDINPVGVGAMLLASLLAILAYTGRLARWPRPSRRWSPCRALTAPLLAWAPRALLHRPRPPAGATAHAPPAGQAECGVCATPMRNPTWLLPGLRLRSARCAAHWTHVAATSVSRASCMNAGHLAAACCPASPCCVCIPACCTTCGFVDDHACRALRWLQPGSHGLEPTRRSPCTGLHQGVLHSPLFVGVLACGSCSTAKPPRRTGGVEPPDTCSKNTPRRPTDAAEGQVQREANAAKSRYVTGLSHELRTPLNSILGYTQILPAMRAWPSQQDALATIHRSGATCCR